MIKTKVIAWNVSNLTDARYFAARAVDYLHFDLSQVSIEKIVSIVNWIEGIEILLSIPGSMNYEEQKNILNLVNPKGYINGVSGSIIPEIGLLKRFRIVQPEALLSNDDPSDFKIIRFTKDYDQLNKNLQKWIVNNSHKEAVFLDIPFSPKTLQMISTDYGIHGILIKGGKEEKPGLKSFDEMEEIFDILDYHY